MAMLSGGLFSTALAASAQTGQAASSASAPTDGSAPAQGNASSTSVPATAETAPAHRPDVPPLPKGKSTILGGSIRSVDPVKDELVLNIYGEKPMRILYDERTQLFRDGKKIPLHEIGPAQHASVQTTLDGAKVFAVSVHVLSQQPEGDYQGRVLSFDSGSGELKLTSGAGGEPFRVYIAKDTSFKRLGQSTFSSVQSGVNDLVPGSLVQIRFAAQKGKGIAQEVSVLAAPGSTFVFSGNVTALDVHTGSLVLLDPGTNQSYGISFDPARPPAQQLHAGQHLRVAAKYDGSRYVATEITIQ